MNYMKAGLLYGVAFILQFSLLNLISVMGITPNLILCLMIFIAYKYNDGFKYAVLAIPFALLSDLIGGQYVGVSALVIFLLCMAVSYFGKGLNRETIWTLLVVAAVGTFIYYFFYWGILIVLGNGSTILGLLKFLALEIPMNLLVMAIAFFIFKHTYRRKLQPTGYAIVDMGMKRNKRNKRINIRNMR